jgi:putative holliday junction resolvase
LTRPAGPAPEHPGRRGRVLGVDLGERRIGLAVSDPSATVASPHTVLARTGDPTRDYRAVVEIAREVMATRIVVGWPRSLSGGEGPAAQGVRREVEALRAIAGAGLPVELHDERFTTVTAERALVSAGVRRRRRRQLVDKVAAAVMLQSYLERDRSS